MPKHGAAKAGVVFICVLWHSPRVTGQADMWHNINTLTCKSYMCNADTEEAWKAMLTIWQTDTDIQEADRGLYALSWAPTATLLRQTLDINLQHGQVVSRSPASSLSAVLRNVGMNPGSDLLHGSDVAWQWVQDNFDAAGMSQ